MTQNAWLTRVAIVFVGGFILPALLFEYGLPWILSGADGPGGFGATVLFALIVCAVWGIAATYLVVVTVMYFRKSGN